MNGSTSEPSSEQFQRKPDRDISLLYRRHMPDNGAGLPWETEETLCSGGVESRHASDTAIVQSEPSPDLTLRSRSSARPAANTFATAHDARRRMNPATTATPSHRHGHKIETNTVCPK